MMSQCVPNWDVSGHRHNPELAGSVAQNVTSASKSKLWDHQQQQFCGRHEVPEHVPDYDEVAELTWVNGHLAMQGLVSKAPNRHHYRSSGIGCYWGNDNHDQASAATRSAQHEKEVDGTLDAIVLHEASRCDINGHADPMANLPTLVDDMVSWFQYPLNDFNPQDAANAAESPRKISEQDIAMRGKCTESTVRCISEGRQIAAANTESWDALVPRNVDADQCNNSMVHHSANPAGAKGGGAGVDDDDDDDVDDDGREVPARANANGSMNFSHFSRPAVMMKANLHVLGAASGPTNIQRVRQHCGRMDEAHQPRHRQQDAGDVSASDAHVTVSIVGSTNGLRTRSFASGEISGSASLHVPRKASRSLPSQVISDDCITKAPDRDPRRNYSMSGSAGTIAREMPSETCDAQDVTLTSTSGCSPNNSAEKCGKETRRKRKSLAEEDWGCQSEDVEDESAETRKKSQGRRCSSTKRSRAAAVHNLSERRRRDRINEKMKALQKLIPNCSKTDKASMLDEAIEYLKHLQAQLQMMSFRSALNVPPVMMPLGMQQLQMSLLASLGQMGLGMGVPGVGLGMGMGMGMMDMNSIAAAGCGIVPMQATASHALQPATFVQPNMGAFSAASADGNDPYTAFMVCQRQPTNMEAYNSLAQLHRHPNHCSPQQEGTAGKPG